MRSTIAVLLAMTISTSAFAQADSALAPGKPAGVHQAQMTMNGDLLLILGGVAVVGAVVAIAASNHHSSSAGGGTTTTTTTTTTGTGA